MWPNCVTSFRESLVKQITVLCVCYCRRRYVILPCCHTLKSLAGQTALKVLELRVDGKLCFCSANLIEQGIVKNKSLSKLKLRLKGELPDNWQAIAENLNVQLAEKSTVTFEVFPNTFSQVTATQLTAFHPCVIKS